MPFLNELFNLGNIIKQALSQPMSKIFREIEWVVGQPNSYSISGSSLRFINLTKVNRSSEFTVEITLSLTISKYLSKYLP